MESRKANLTTAANRGSHQMSMDDTETGEGNFQLATPLRTRRPCTEGKFQLSQLIDVHNILVPMGLPGGMDGTANRGNVVLKWEIEHYDWPGVTG